jgi:hypothetical protein
VARVLAIIDRPPADPSWKGAAAWKMIHSLAESQHEVRVLTTLAPESVACEHPRLTVTRPVRSWKAAELPRLMQAIWAYQPDIIHTFSLQPSSLWPSLAVWPWLTGITKVLPTARRWSTLFDEEDLNPKDAAFGWHTSGYGMTVISPAVRERIRAHFSGPVETVPLDLDLPEAPIQLEAGPFVLIPAAVDRWQNPQPSLHQLAAFLTKNRELSAVIVGGWGALAASERKQGWKTLSAVMAQVRLTGPLSLNELLHHARKAERLWLEPLPGESWNALVARTISGTLREGPEGSAANFLSRLYSQS